MHIPIEAIVSKLIEDIQLCTAGFQNRVNDIIASFYKLRTLLDLLYQVRIELVKNLGIKLTSEIHAWNRVTKIAAAHGLIKANFSNDLCSGELKTQTIHSSLQKEFEEKYTASNLPFLLAEQLRGILVSIGYTGPNEDGYSVGTVDKLTEQIQCFLSKEITGDDWDRFFIIQASDDFDITIRDLNWKLIRKYFFLTLLHEKYITQSPLEMKPRNLLDLACLSDLFCKNETYDDLSIAEFITPKLFK
ncbi:MAG: hypothetical protein WAL30_01495 [Candidatus Aquirickettsiella sp.]